MPKNVRFFQFPVGYELVRLRESVSSNKYAKSPVSFLLPKENLIEKIPRHYEVCPVLMPVCTDSHSC
jgi:hypothetical protein